MGINDLSSSITNINILIKSNKISTINKFILLFGTITHWLFMGGISTYFVWGNVKYDKYILYSLIFIILQWFVIYQDCVASYYEKIIIKDEPEIDIDNMRNPSFDLFCYNNHATIVIEIIVAFLMIFNFALIMLRNNIPKIIVLIYIILSIFLNLFYRYYDLIKIYKLK